MKYIDQLVRIMTILLIFPTLLFSSTATIAANCEAKIIFDNLTQRQGILILNNSRGQSIKMYSNNTIKWGSPTDCTPNTLVSAYFITGMGEGEHYCRPVGQSLVGTTLHIILGRDPDHAGYDSCTTTLS